MGFRAQGDCILGLHLDNMSIKFGTDGWRAVIADDFTFENLRKISKATAIAFENHNKIKNGIVIGYDTRFLSKEFSECSAEIFANHGIKVYLTDSFVTTPTVSLITRNTSLAFGVMITSSHNPFKYSGYKLKDEYGGSMGVELLSGIEEILNSSNHFDYGYKKFYELISDGLIEYIPGRQIYIDTLRTKINTRIINDSQIKIIFDAMYGSGQGMMDDLINLTSIRNEVNPSFGGINPEPVEKNLKLISEIMRGEKYDIGIATDGDADRIAILDEKGNFVDAQKTFALLLLYLLEKKNLNGGVVRGFSSSELIKRICDKYDLKLYTVKIGFKYISELMIKEDILIGAEESGGIGLRMHLPERDGIFNGLLFCELLASNRKKLSELVYELEAEFGKTYYKRIDKHLLDNEQKFNCIEAAKHLTTVAGQEILNKDELDGVKLFFKNGWLLIRASGTEPLLRLYTESYDSDITDTILTDIIQKLNLG